MTDKNYFILGGSGFLGKNFIDILKTKKINKKILVLSRKKKKKIDNFKWIKGNLDNDYKTYLKKTDCVFCFVSSLNDKPSLNKYLNVDFFKTFNFLEKARNYGVKNFFIIGSSFELGFNNLSKNLLTLNPINDYAITKVLNLILLRWWSKKYDLNINYGRIFQMYGNYEKSDRLFPYIREKAIKNKTFILNKPKDKRDFINVKNVCETIYQNISKFDKFRIINICSGKSETIESFSKKVWKTYSDKKIKYKYLNKNNKPFRHLYGNKKQMKIKNFIINLKI